MAEIYITSQDLLKTLKISDQELIDTERFFDSIPDDEWELIEGKDYKVVNKSNGLRDYTLSGAYTLARYLELTRKKSFWDILKEWFTHAKKDLRRAFIRKKILDNCSSLVKRRDQFWVSKADVVAIFGTRSDYLSKMAEYAKRTEHSLIEGQDFDDFLDGGGQHFSLSGIYKLAQAFKENLSKKNRQEWCWDVGDVVKPQIEDIVTKIQQRDKRIQTTMDKVKKRDSQTCRVTGDKKTRVNNLKLAAHHLYSQNEYPHLADVENNLVTLAYEVHEQFHHNFMGGSNKPCTIDDFINFVQQYYPSKTQIVIDLEQQRLVLGDPQPVNARKPHVLYLPVSRVQ